MEFYQVHNKLISSETVSKAHANGAKLIAWDVQTQKLVNKMKDLQVDIIETDHPPASFTEKPSFSK